jgi:hypothetical protein
MLPACMSLSFVSAATLEQRPIFTIRVLQEYFSIPERENIAAIDLRALAFRICARESPQ